MKYRLLNLALDLAANLVGPWITFELLDNSCGDTKALIASAFPPLAWSALELGRVRRVDALSTVILSGILLTIAATLCGGSPKLLQIRENAVTGAIGIMFLMSLFLKRPLIYHLASAVFTRQGHEAGLRLETLVARPEGAVFFRRLTMLWGVGLVVQTAILVWLAFIWPIGRFLLFSPPIGYGLLGFLLIVTLWYRRRAKLI